MIISLEKALNIVGERSADSYRMLKQARRQRRTEYTDIPCIPFHNELTGDEAKSKFRCHIIVSRDKNYWERFQFKLAVSANEDVNINENDITFKIIKIGEDGAEYPVDITDYLRVQYDSWIDSASKSISYYPSEDIEIDTSDVGDFYDILQATCDMKAEYNGGGFPDNMKYINRILDAGTKIIEIGYAGYEDKGLDFTFIPYAKHSNVNR